MRVIANRWLKQVDAWRADRDYEGIQIPGPRSHQELTPLLESRARLFLAWADDDSLWPE